MQPDSSPELEPEPEQEVGLVQVEDGQALELEDGLERVEVGQVLGEATLHRVSILGLVEATLHRVSIQEEAEVEFPHKANIQEAAEFPRRVSIQEEEVEQEEEEEVEELHPQECHLQGPGQELCQ